jgi:membrane protein DedA with SNARE-associated domain
VSGGIGGFARDFVENHGLAAVFGLMATESCGIPFPSEVIMPVAGAVAAGALVGGSHLGLVPAIVAGAAGNLLGSLIAWILDPAGTWASPARTSSSPTASSHATGCSPCSSAGCCR